MGVAVCASQVCGMVLILGLRAFREPLPLDAYWLVLLLPLVLGIAIVYKTIKLEDLSLLPRQALSLAGQIIVFMVLAAGVLWLATELM